VGSAGEFAPIPVGTKFIEENAGILRGLLDVVVADALDPAAATFAERFNLLVEPPRVRFRFLDTQLREATGWPVMDCSIPSPSFAEQTWGIARVELASSNILSLRREKSGQVRACPKWELLQG
jgi:hypothetical protein